MKEKAYFHVLLVDSLDLLLVVVFAGLHLGQQAITLGLCLGDMLGQSRIRTLYFVAGLLDLLRFRKRSICKAQAASSFRCFV